MSHEKGPGRVEIALRIFCSVQRTGLLADLAIYKEVVGRCFDIADMFLEATKHPCCWCVAPAISNVCKGCGVAVCSGATLDTHTRHATPIQQYHCDGCGTYFCHLCLTKHEHRPAAPAG